MTTLWKAARACRHCGTPEKGPDATYCTECGARLDAPVAKRTTSATDPRSGLLPELEAPPEGAPKSAIFHHILARAASLGMTVLAYIDTPEGARLYAHYVSADEMGLPAKKSVPTLAAVMKSAVESGDVADYFRRNAVAYQVYRSGVSVPVGPNGGER